MWAAILAALKTVGGISGLLNNALQWFREMSRDDMAAKAEQLRLMEAERKADEKSRDVKPVGPDDVIKRLRDSGAEF